ncbi:MAG: response regulator [Planctomycetes bacterium]|nr:response regulator [Planctomycetota bacterium]
MGTDQPKPDCECATPHVQLATAENGNGHPKVSVLLIDDDKDDYLLTKELVSDIPGGRFTLDWASTYDAGVNAICGGTHDIYLLDYRLGAKTGIELLNEIHAHGCSGPVILLTGQGQSQTDLEALDAGADDYLEKTGLTSAVLERAMRYALVQHRAAAELERKVHERTEELAKVNDALREANRRKDEFLSTLGHELRNPLAPILNGLEIMRIAADNPETITRQRERLERQVSQMTRLVEDLLDVSRITTGKLRLNPEPVTLQEVIESAIEISRPQIDKARLLLSVNLPPEPVSLLADRVRLAQVFSNLLNNAAKYTESGGRVSLSVECEARNGSASPAAFVRVRVRDSGVGIPAALLPKIFELFTQVNHTLNRSQGGLGVGLALVRRLVELHGGTVSAHSDGPGTGAEFTVSLPMA